MTKVVNILTHERKMNQSDNPFVDRMITEHGNKMCPVDIILPSVGLSS